MAINIPEIFYKYRPFDDRSISMLANNQLYFTSPPEFNDPFDCAAQEDIFEGLLQTINEMKKYPSMSTIMEMQYKVLQNIGILTLTKCPDSILMWAHYTDNHKGFCLGFKNNPGLDSIKPVNYVTNRPKNTAYQYTSMEDKNCDAILAKFITELIYTKYIDWRYEEEWRAIGNNGTFTYPVDCLDRVIFGVKMPQENRNIILDMLKNENVSFFEAIKSKNSFAIEIKAIT